MKKSIGDKTREYIEQEYNRRIGEDLSKNIKLIKTCFEGSGYPMTLQGLVYLSGEYRAFLPPTPFDGPLPTWYIDLGYSEFMPYEEFVFSFPRIWYTTSFRLFNEWMDKACADELAY